MSFLKYVDRLHKEAQKRNNENDIIVPKDYILYIPIQLNNNDNYSCKFIVCKSKKTKMYIVAGLQRIYMDDNQIIDTILNMEDDDVKWFINQFINLYEGKGKKIIFRIRDTDFCGTGIDNYPEKKEITLFSDAVITFNDFIFLLNFVFSKDVWSYKDNRSNTSKNTLIKYIILLSYKKFHNPKSKAVINEVGYVPDSQNIIDYKNNKKSLEKAIEIFDINDYK